MCKKFWELLGNFKEIYDEYLNKIKTNLKYNS